MKTRILAGVAAALTIVTLTVLPVAGKAKSTQTQPPHPQDCALDLTGCRK